MADLPRVGRVPDARPASTVVLLRDGEHGMETLMLRRNKALLFAGGLWVFPGGALDAEDFDAAHGDEVEAARIAAAREAREEAGLAPRLEDMVLLSHWTTPRGETRRYATWIWAAPLAAQAEVAIDGGEIHDACWLPVREAIARHDAGDMGMLPPTYVTLRHLRRYPCVADMVDEERHTPAPEVFPVLAAGDTDMLVLFRGDAGYESADGSLPGARHRATLRGRIWTYDYQGVEVVPPLIRD